MHSTMQEVTTKYLCFGLPKNLTLTILGRQNHKYLIVKNYSNSFVLYGSACQLYFTIGT